MLAEFSVGNFWSFKEIQTLHLQAAPIKSKFPETDRNNIFSVSDKLSLLKSKAIFGANSSGKTNLMRGITAILTIVKDCLKNDRVLQERVFPFVLQEETAKQPSFFQVVFVLDNVQYRYGFEANQQQITSEWLFGKPLVTDGGMPLPRERYYFKREKRDIEINEEHFKEGTRFVHLGSDAPPLYRDNSLFLSVVAAFNGKIAQGIYNYFMEHFSIVSGLDDPDSSKRALNALENKEFKNSLSDLLKAVDGGIDSVELMEVDKNNLPNLPEEALHKKIGYAAVYRTVFSEEGKKVGKIPLALRIHEAAGTQKLFELSPILFKYLAQGGTFFIDEFDARMHPRLTQKIVALFHDEKTNPNNAQLIFATHDSNLLDAKLLRRDQITFVKKDTFGASELYSLVEFKGVRNDASFEKDYLLGKYGAVPTTLNLLEEAIENYTRNAQKNELH